MFLLLIYFETAYCSVKCNRLGRIDRGRNTLCFAKGVATRILNETIIPDKPLRQKLMI